VPPWGPGLREVPEHLEHADGKRAMAVQATHQPVDLRMLGRPLLHAAPSSFCSSSTRLHVDSRRPYGPSRRSRGQCFRRPARSRVVIRARTLVMGHVGNIAATSEGVQRPGTEPGTAFTRANAWKYPRIDASCFFA